jgi:hypothetical protein
MLIFGTIISALASLADPSIINIIILAIYLPLWLLGVRPLFKYNAWGTVVDSADGVPLQLALVRAYTKNRTKASQRLVGLWPKPKNPSTRPGGSPLGLRAGRGTEEPTTEELKNGRTEEPDQASSVITDDQSPFGGLVRTVVSNEKGKFSLRLEPGDYQLAASKTDYSNFKPRKLKLFKGLDFVNLLIKLTKTGRDKVDFE